MAFNGLDWAIVTIVLVSTLISLKRGFIKESLSLVIWVLAFVVALVFYPEVSVRLQTEIDSASLRKLVSILILFVGTLLVGSLFLYVVGRLVVFTGLSGLDRVLGLVFGALRGVVIVVFVMIGLQALLPVQQEAWWHYSVLVPHFSQLESWLLALTDDIRVLIQEVLGRIIEQKTTL